MLVRLADSESPEIRNCIREMLDEAVKIVHTGLLQGLVRVIIVHLEHYLRNRIGTRLRQQVPCNVTCRPLQPSPSSSCVRQTRLEYLKTCSKFYDNNPLNVTAYSMFLKSQGVEVAFSIAGQALYLNDSLDSSLLAGDSGHLPSLLMSLLSRHGGDT
jgi:hypothetical protein